LVSKLSEAKAWRKTEKFSLNEWPEIILAPITTLPAGTIQKIQSVESAGKVYFAEVYTS
jgi:hypothetical protein